MNCSVVTSGKAFDMLLMAKHQKPHFLCVSVPLWWV